MRFPVYSYRDKNVGFGQPIVENNEMTAVRGFSYAVNGRDGLMNFSPGDYDLYHIGYFDSEKGVLEPLSPVVLVASGSSVVNVK